MNAFAPLLLGLALLPACFGCTQIERFSTTGSTAYCGSLIGTPSFHSGFIRAGAPPTLQLALTLDIEHISTLPGTLTSDDAERGLCAEESQPLFEKAQLRAIEELAHDPLSTLEFGEAREHNFHAWVDSNCAGTVLAVVSLMKDENVEVRLLKAASEPLSDTPAHERPGFALFRLQRQASGCGF